jgi:hypothetical protein
LLAIFTVIEYSANAASIAALRNAIKRYASYLWIFILQQFFVLGGLVLLVVPGLLILGWSSVALYTVAPEQKRGIQAFYRSKHMISGRWWKVVWRWLCLFVPIALVVLVVFGLLAKSGFSPESFKIKIFVNIFISLFLPYTLTYGRFLHDDLVSTYVEIPIPAKEKNFLYIVTTVLGCIVVVPVAAIIILNITAIDEQPPYDSDLALKKVEIPKDQNIAEDLDFSFPHKDGNIPKINRETATTTNMATGKTWDSDVASKFIADNEKFFTWFDQEFPKKLYYQDPALADPAAISDNPAAIVLPSLNTLRMMARAESIRAEYLFRNGKEKEAIDESIKIIRLGHMIVSSQGTIIEYLVGIAIKDLGYKRLRLLVDRTAMPQNLLMHYLEILAQYRDNHSGLKVAWKFEYLMQKWTAQNLRDLYRKKLMDDWSDMTPLIYEGNYYYKPNKTAHIFADSARRNIANVDRLCSDRIPYHQEPITLSNSLLDSARILFIENAVGKILDEIINVSLDSLFVKKCSLDFSGQSSELLLALKIYQIENKILPSDLHDLITYVPASTLQDPFDGKQIRYSQDKKIIYSVGSDGIDSGGSDEINWSRSLDPTVEFSF